MTHPQRGDIYLCALDPVAGAEQGGDRPVVVVSNDAFNAVLPLASVVPVTTFRRRSGVVYPSECLLPSGAGHLRAPSLALCHQVRTISRDRLQRRLGSLEPDLMRTLDEALVVHLGLAP